MKESEITNTQEKISKKSKVKVASFDELDSTSMFLDPDFLEAFLKNDIQYLYKISHGFKKFPKNLYKGVIFDSL